MLPFVRRRSTLGLLSLLLPTAALAADPAQSAWVHEGTDGKLLYKTTAAGDRITDFSTAGYKGGGVALPDVPTKLTLAPSDSGDDTSRIQAAIDSVSQLPLENGVRGAVQLAPGTFRCTGSLSILANGVVLRGSGSSPADPKSTTIEMSGGRHAAISIGKSGHDPGDPSGRRADPSESSLVYTEVADSYVPCGATSLSVASVQSFAVGDSISIERPVTKAWIKFMGMDTLVRNGGPETWIREGIRLSIDRKIAAISGNKITLDSPLTDSIDGAYLNPPGAVVVKRSPSPLVSNSGAEDLHIHCPTQHVAMTAAIYSGIRVSGEDCWVRNIAVENAVGAVGVSGRRITIERVSADHPVSTIGAAKPADFGLNASQLLLDRCTGHGNDVFYSATGAGESGPMVMLHCTFEGNGHIQPHQRWSTALLVDNCSVPGGGIDFMNRGEMGSGHGWTMGWGVIWNSQAKGFTVQNPPGCANWLIGCVGEIETARRPFEKDGPVLPGGTVDSPGVNVVPQSLYLAQLSDRLGPQAVRNIGY